MRAVKPSVEPVKLLGEDDHISVVRLRDQGNSFHVTEILRLRQGDPHSISRVGAVSDEVLPFQLGDAGVFNPELFIRRKGSVPLGNQKGLWIGLEMESIETAC